LTVNAVISTVAGGGNARPDTIGIPATSAALSPSGIAVDIAGNLYIASGLVLNLAEAFPLHRGAELDGRDRKVENNREQKNSLREET